MGTNPARWTGGSSRCLLVVIALLSTTSLTAQEIARPAEITVEQVQEGLRLYHGKGACAVCHGDLGVGTVEGPLLVSGQWQRGPGTYEWLRHITRHAGWGATTRAGDPQPMRGPTVLDTAEVNAVAAYVWSISRGRAAAAP
jgi:mono/diheme cytochrome c family protein